MRTFWRPFPIGYRTMFVHPSIDHWYVENDRVYVVTRDGDILASSRGIEDIEFDARRGKLIEKDLPEEHAKRISNNKVLGNWRE